MKYKEEVKKFLGQIKNTKLLVIIFIVGIVLILLPSGNGKGSKEVVLKEDSVEIFKQTMEKELEDALSSVKGAGKVQVLINLDDSGESFVAADEKSEENISGEENTESFEKNYVLKNDDGGGQSPIVLRKSMPKISGILVIAEGAENERIKNELTLAVKAISGVRAHRVYVLPKK